MKFRNVSRLGILVIILLLIAGCSQAGASPTGEGGEGAEGEPLLIGLEAPMTGDYAYEGQGFEKAVRLRIKQINDAGGVNGRPIELIVEDDKGDPQEASLVADRLVSAGVVAVIGAYNSTATEPASEIYNEAGILHITPSSTATPLTEKGFEQFFRVCFLDDRQAFFAVSYMNDVLGAQNIGILHDNSTYAKGLADWTQVYAEEAGLNVAYFDAINPDDTDFTPILTAIKDANLDVIYFTGYHAQGGQLLRQGADVGLETPWMMGNASNNPELVEIAGVENAAGTVITTEVLPKDIDSPEAREFVAAFEEEYGEPLESIWWLMAAEAMNVIAHAIDQTDSTDTAVLADYLHNDLENFAGVTGNIIGFDEKGDREGTIHQAYIINAEGVLKLATEQP